MLKPCEYCGNEHDVTQLCHARPKWSRRGFISMFGAGVVGVMLPLPQIITIDSARGMLALPPPVPIDFDFITEAWNRIAGVPSATPVFTGKYLESVYNEIKNKAAK